MEQLLIKLKKNINTYSNKNRQTINDSIDTLVFILEASIDW